MTDKMQNALRHIETAVDVDEWAMYTVKECFEKLDKIEQIISNFDESSNYYQTLEQIAKVVEP